MALGRERDFKKTVRRVSAAAYSVDDYLPHATSA